MTNGSQTVTLQGRTYKIALPGYAEREDIAVGFTAEENRPRRRQRALLGALGLCIPELGGGLAAYEAADLDLVKFGGRVYSALMATGHDRDELATAAVECFQVACQSLFPREKEVATVEDFIDPAAVVAT